MLSNQGRWAGVLEDDFDRLSFAPVRQSGPTARRVHRANSQSRILLPRRARSRQCKRQSKDVQAVLSDVPSGRQAKSGHVP